MQKRYKNNINPPSNPVDILTNLLVCSSHSSHTATVAPPSRRGEVPLPAHPKCKLNELSFVHAK